MELDTAAETMESSLESIQGVAASAYFSTDIVLISRHLSQSLIKQVIKDDSRQTLCDKNYREARKPGNRA